jgi:hypothetical protein
MEGSDVVLGYVLTDNVTGMFVTTFVVPPTVGGTHWVTAEANNSASTSDDASFDVLPTLTVTPTTTPNNGTIITVSGSGLGYDIWYDLCLDNAKNFYSANIIEEYNFTYLDWVIWEEEPFDIWPPISESAVTSYFKPDCEGNFDFEVVAAGFQPGLHVFTLYELVAEHELPDILDFVLFTITEEADPIIIEKLDEILMELEEATTTLMDLNDAVTSGQPAVLAGLNGISDDIAAALADVLASFTDIELLAENAASAATAAETSAGTAAQAATDAKTAAEGTQGTIGSLPTLIYVSIILSIVAALAAIVAVVILNRKVA